MLCNVIVYLFPAFDNKHIFHEIASLNIFIKVQSFILVIKFILIIFVKNI